MGTNLLSPEAKKELDIIKFETEFDTMTEREYIYKTLLVYTMMKTGFNINLKLYIRKQVKIYTELKNFIEAVEQ